MADIKIAERLAEIIGMLNKSEGINTSLLANQFNVSERTVRRDINERLRFLDIDKSKPLWSLRKNKAGKLNKAIISKFSNICGVRDLFPIFNESFLNELFSDNQDSPYLIKSVNYEVSCMPQYRHQFTKISKAIRSNYKVDFYYNEKEYKNIEPYKLISFQGCWYLAAIDAGKLKIFQVGLIEILLLSNELFLKDKEIEIINDDTIWISEGKIKVILKVNKNVASHFERRRVLPEQKIKDKLDNGSLLIATNIVNQLQVFPIVKSWIPNIEMIYRLTCKTNLIKNYNHT
ncbi:helix-turn-helix transcriptional regulator [Shewanella sp. 10N.286.48.A6]|uniref:helix-turn-helix transcriptional regulator n=1 Tax=Shewanella sp. 10N.286.48.A6 TaxID=1880833 RepID=UPI000C82EA04|nr:WYL domain-containing transcriptional regulator [Shewanella sp. 10N.286.48.A6]PMI01884.1 hypothetical protein BCU55_09400 [Shewanella sp. 10N.286.48.A6]